MAKIKRIRCGFVLFAEKIGYLLCVGVSTACLQSCQLRNPANPQSQVALTNYSKEYSFVMDEAKQRELLQKLSQMRLGESRANVIRKLGTPSHDREIRTKERGEFRGHLVTYYIKIWDKELVNTKHDRFVMLRFDTNDSLTKIIKKIGDSD